MMARAIIPLVTIGALVVSPSALACKCALVSRDEAIAAAAVVFDGEVLRVERDGEDKNDVVTLRVARAIKGVSPRVAYRLDAALRRRAEKSVTVITRASAAACGWDFRQGPQRLTVGAERDKLGTLVATRCTMMNLNR